MFYIFMDLEYNTIDFRNSKFRKSSYTSKILNNELMQVEIQIYNDNMKLINSVSEYVKPVFTEKVSKIVYDITRISNEQLNRAEANTATMCHYLNELFSSINGDAVIITWGNDDERVLKSNFEACGVEWNIDHKWIDLQVVFANKYNYYDEFDRIRTASLTDAGIMCGIPFSTDNMHNAKWDVKLLLDIADEIGYDFMLSNYNKREPIKKITITDGDYMFVFNPNKDPHNIVKYTGTIENVENIKIEDDYENMVRELGLSEDKYNRLIGMIKRCRDRGL